MVEIVPVALRFLWRRGNVCIFYRFRMGIFHCVQQPRPRFGWRWPLAWKQLALQQRALDLRLDRLQALLAMPEFAPQGLVVAVLAAQVHL